MKPLGKECFRAENPEAFGDYLVYLWKVFGEGLTELAVFFFPAEKGTRIYLHHLSNIMGIEV